MERISFVYIMANDRNTVLYVGVTSNLVRRTFEHRNGLIKGFTKKYNIHKLVYFECHPDIGSAIKREKQIKGGSRAKKIAMIESKNKDWKDLYYSIID